MFLSIQQLPSLPTILSDKCINRNNRMVKLHVKQGDTSLFLYETVCSVSILQLLREITEIHNLRLKVDRVCDEIVNMADHGVALPPHIQGLTDEQVSMN